MRTTVSAAAVAVAAAAAAEVSNNHDGNPTGAVVPAISLATTFKQRTPGEPMAR